MAELSFQFNRTRTTVMTVVQTSMTKNPSTSMSTTKDVMSFKLKIFLSPKKENPLQSKEATLVESATDNSLSKTV